MAPQVVTEETALLITCENELYDDGLWDKVSICGTGCAEKVSSGAEPLRELHSRYFASCVLYCAQLVPSLSLCTG